MTETDTEKTPEQLQARITELKELYQGSPQNSGKNVR